MIGWHKNRPAVSRRSFRVIRRIVSHDHTSPPNHWYDQVRHEWALLLEGAAQLRFEDDDQLVEMVPGDSVEITAHRRHRVEWTSPDEPTIWLAVFHGWLPYTENPLGF